MAAIDTQTTTLMETKTTAIPPTILTQKLAKCGAVTAGHVDVVITGVATVPILNLAIALKPLLKIKKVVALLVY